MEQPYISSTILSKELNIPASTIRAYRNARGAYINNRFEPNPDEFIELYSWLKSSRKLAEHYGVTKRTILDYAKAIGYNTNNKRILTEAQEQVIAECYTTHASIELAEKFGVSSSKITQVWTKYGLTGKENRPYKIEKQDYFHCIDSLDKAYFLGFIGSDGCIYHSEKYDKQDVLRISIEKTDIKILELLKQCLYTNKPIHQTKEKYVSLEISSQAIVDDLSNLDLKPRKTYSNTIATIDDTFMSHLIRGYFDGDGCIRRKSNSDVDISISGYHANLEKIQLFLEKNNIFTTFVADNRKYHDAETGIFGNLIMPNRCSKYAFLKLIYQDCGEFYLNRKYEVASEFINYIESSKEIRDKQIKIYYDYAVRRVG